MDEWKLLLRAALRDALRARDPLALSMIRETLAVIDNAEAPDTSLAPAAQSEIIAGAVDGLGAGEIARRQLSPQDVEALIHRELRDRRDAAASYEALGRKDEADALRRQAERLESLCSPVGSDATTAKP